MSNRFSSALFLIYWLNLAIVSNATKNLTFLALANLNRNTGVGVQWIATQEVNNNSELLPNYTLHLKVFDTQTNVQHTLRQTLEIVEYESDENNIYFPIILGPAWSSLSSAAGPVLNTFDMGLISESATSVLLSDSDEYPYFYRFVNFV